MARALRAGRRIRSAPESPGHHLKETINRLIPRKNSFTEALTKEDVGSRLLQIWHLVLGYSRSGVKGHLENVF